MPNLKSAKKELRKGSRRQERNEKVKKDVKTLVKKTAKIVVTKDASAKEMLAKTLKALDKARQKGIIKKNTANRKKSRLHKKFNQSQK